MLPAELAFPSVFCSNETMKSMTPPQKNDICPIAMTSSLIGDVWVILIIRDLLKGAKRFNELQHSLIAYGEKNSINSRTLTGRLKMLEKEGVITRIAFAHEMPPKVEYSLTKKGKALSTIIEKMRQYGKSHF
jgi:DNA-binding HxlR family transcriptional regulator